MKIKILFLVLSVFLFTNLRSQNTTITAPVNNGFISSAIAPNGTVTHSTLRTHFIIPAAELQGIPVGTLIDEIGINIQAAGTGAASGTLQFYIENTSDAVNSKSPDWSIAIAPMTSVYSGAFAIPTAAGPADFPLSSAFTYSGGGLYVAYEYLGTVSGSAPAIYWVNTNMSNSSMTSSTSSSTPLDSVNTVSDSRPETRFTFVNPYTNNLEVSRIRTEYGVANSYLTADNDVYVEISNIGTQAVTNASVTLELTGSTTYTSSQTISSIGSNGSQILTFSNVPVGAAPSQTIKISVPSDQQTFNDSLEYIQVISCDSIGYTDSGPATSSVGFNTGQGILGVRYDLSNTLPVNVKSLTLE